MTLVASDVFGGFDDTYAAHVQINAAAGVAYAIGVSTVAGYGGDLALCIVPAALPERQANMDNISTLADGSCHLHFTTGTTGNWVIDASEDMVVWVPTSIAFPPGCSLDFNDYNAAMFPVRFYRLRDTQ